MALKLFVAEWRRLNNFLSARRPKGDFNKVVHHAKGRPLRSIFLELFFQFPQGPETFNEFFHTSILGAHMRSALI
jgi:hypothetical protein